jgi:hypothetical protein
MVQLKDLTAPAAPAFWTTRMAWRMQRARPPFFESTLASKRL